MPKPFLTLAISHNIHLTPQQRRDLSDGLSVYTVGVSVPVYYVRNSGKTSEPASEVFVEYLLHNSPAVPHSVHFREAGYEMNIPQLPTGFEMPAEISDQDWSLLQPEERESLCEERYVPPCGLNLRDVRDGGSGVLRFSGISHATIQGILTLVHHTVRIADISEIANSEGSPSATSPA